MGATEVQSYENFLDADKDIVEKIYINKSVKIESSFLFCSKKKLQGCHYFFIFLTFLQIIRLRIKIYFH